MRTVFSIIFLTVFICSACFAQEANHAVIEEGLQISDAVGEQQKLLKELRLLRMSSAESIFVPYRDSLAMFERLEELQKLSEKNN